jgi:hypothetical protein
MSTIASHVWKPSVARTVTLDAFVPVPRGTTSVVPAVPSWPLKDPGDLLDYQFDIAPALIGNDGDAISTLDITLCPANPGDLALSSTTADGTRAVLWLGGGQPGTTYTVTLTIGTQAGRTIARSVMLPVAALANLPPAPDALLTSNGTPLVDQNGNPILASP